MTNTQVEYSNIKLFIDGTWRDGSSGETVDVLNPATNDVIGHIAKATTADLDDALAAAERGFEIWRKVSAFDRYKMLRKAADIFRARGEGVARLLTIEQGKPLSEARAEAAAAGDLIDWFAEEARRSYGRIVPSRFANVMQSEVKEPVGPVAAFTPWNFPINQSVRKISAALAAGCSIILKAAEDTPAAPAELVRAFADAGLPDGVINLVYGDPAEISSYLIPHPVIKKVSFTGSTQVGKQLAALSGLHMKRATMELGGHAPVVIMADADVEQAIKVAAAAKFRNAGQICIAPTRFLIEEAVYDQVIEGLSTYARSLKVGDGLDAETTMGPLVNARRVNAMERLIGDAKEHKAKVVTGGERIGNRGNFFEPTILADVPRDAAIMNEEPFGPVALLNRFQSLDEALVEANRLNYGLAAYAFTGSSPNAAKISSSVRSGMITINHYGLALPEVPFGGINDSGYGTEGGADALDAYQNTKFVSHLQA
ncbi:NAD-dependent succinate-semialdehyde dehydrogenase [Brucella pseudogrignonensis]|uniref:NAD-dependent succinate-semialdehyde dehydrogenase n=1 Tax=Brucella pseudogrignonensis TaxID=419475 RepID=UPI000CFBC694|nr:NAD-dependent succinate-semialdehyde dehydrogenase [Brucella pseudogrignonensis]MQP41339.1 aldehyde dehydrogenase family protein [Ochrobactrum sp. MYb237]PQZ40274.1 NAD-dependent succinate-semialdehyde dehydrogenase [Brucella pseudogrignonensis]PRA40233.1 NAD-dependent succinate-semialdehyde dehydrogenase [Brucella pseudogrignonensis]PRA67764.1 NAD-dependent succinate-semialdehyde dehydrogenase [Brucella pseudogrignonensis]